VDDAKGTIGTKFYFSSPPFKAKDFNFFLQYCANQIFFFFWQNGMGFFSTKPVVIRTDQKSKQHIDKGDLGRIQEDSTC